jgi:methylmalonyl-CoA/ethylmalonyl-CoA epimerase
VKFDHIGITTWDLASGRALLERSVMVREWTSAFEDPVNDVRVQFGRCPSSICYELVAPLSGTGPITRALSKKINIINHIAYLVNDLAAHGARLEAEGFVPVAPARPALAYGGRPIRFFISKSRMMVELIEAPDHQHDYNPTV